MVFWNVKDKTSETSNKNKLIKRKIIFLNNKIFTTSDPVDIMQEVNTIIMVFWNVKDNPF